MPDLRLRLDDSASYSSPLLWLDAPDQDAAIARLPVYDGFGWTLEEQREHGRRIVACTNFCIGTDSDFLNGAGNLGRMLAGVPVNQELLAALRDAREWVERCRSVLHDFGQHEDAIAAQVALDRIDCIMRDSQ